jgi:hypothetical protein
MVAMAGHVTLFSIGAAFPAIFMLHECSLSSPFFVGVFMMIHVIALSTYILILLVKHHQQF